MGETLDNKRGGAYMEEEMMENVHIYVIIRKENYVIGSLDLADGLCCNSDAADHHRAATSLSSRNVHSYLTCTADHTAILSAGRRPRPLDRKTRSSGGGVTPHASQKKPQKVQILSQHTHSCTNTASHMHTLTHLSHHASICTLRHSC